MKKRNWIWIAVLIPLAFIATSIYAGNKFEDVIKMNEPSYPHKKGIIEFKHAEHIDKYKLKCGECHHDKNNKPLNNLKKGDNVQRCFECHNKPGEIKGKKAKGLSKKEKLQYHANALHKNCKGCHKAYNKKNKTKKAPTTCNKCHPKKKK